MLKRLDEIQVLIKEVKKSENEFLTLKLMKDLEDNFRVIDSFSESLNEDFLQSLSLLRFDYKNLIAKIKLNRHERNN